MVFFVTDLCVKKKPAQIIAWYIPRLGRGVGEGGTDIFKKLDGSWHPWPNVAMVDLDKRSNNNDDDDNTIRYHDDDADDDNDNAIRFTMFFFVDLLPQQ